MPPIRLDLGRVLSGNWLGSAGVALLMLVTAGVLSGALTLLAKPDDFGIANTLTLGMTVLAATFGANAFFDGHIDDEDLDVDVFTGTFPLTVTILTLLVGVIAFRRMVRGYPSALPALGDAARVALFTALPLFVGALVLRSDIDDLGGGWIGDLSEEIGRRDEGTWGASATGALFLTFALVAFVLALTCLARRDWWPDRMRPFSEWTAPAVQGIALIAVLLPVCGAIGLGLLTLGPDNDVDLHEMTADETSATVAVIAGGLANGGQVLLGLGSGAELGGSNEIASTNAFGTDSEDRGEDFHRLGWFAGDEGEEPGLWAAPFVLFGVLAVSAWWVASRSRERTHVARNLAVWCALLLVAVPWLTRLASLHGGGDLASDGDEATISGYAGLNGLEATIFTFLIALVVASVFVVVKGSLDTRQLRGALGRLQVNPAAGPPPPPAQQPTQPPTQPPPPPST